MIKHWTEEEELLLISMRSTGATYPQIADKLDRTLEAVKTRAKRLKARGLIEGSTRQGNFGWSKEEIAKLYEDLDYDELEKVLGRSRRSIMSKCEKLGISKRFPGYSKSTGTMYRDKPAILYLVDFGDFKKVGVTQVPLSERLKQDGNFDVLDTCEMDLEEALETEREILRNMRKFRITGDIRRGASECFKFNCTLLEEII